MQNPTPKPLTRQERIGLAILAVMLTGLGVSLIALVWSVIRWIERN